MRRILVRSILLTGILVPLSAQAGDSVVVPCTAGRLELKAGSTLALGTSGAPYSTELVSGAAVGFDIVSRCSDDSSACLTNADCESETCVATCDCGADTSCEIAGPFGERHCLTTLATCSSEEDCAGGVPCVPFFAPPQPLARFGIPLCATTNFNAPIEGEIDTAEGEVALRGRLNWRVFLGISLGMPCPRCGAPQDDPQIGDSRTCEGGQRDGLACTVDGVTEEFGGVSYDCAPTLAANIGGPGVAVPLFEMSTEATTRTAQLPCSYLSFRPNPLDPETNPRCTDQREPEGPACTSNSDCRRCSEDFSIACTSNGDCSGAGVCAEAPDQPVTCGYWCHCGFCDGNAILPCMENIDCPAEQECTKGTGLASQATAPQSLPNECSADAFICGTVEPETCASSTMGSCSLAPWKVCDDDEDCIGSGGSCAFSPQSCFGPRIERAGSSSALGTFCALEDKECSSNADCTQPDDSCADDVALPSLAGLSCMPATSSAYVNAGIGITGPVAFEWATRLTMCGCEGPESGCEETCDTEPGCGDGFVQGNEDCDGGPCCNDDCAFEDASVTCRGAAGACDAAETCSGSAAACPANAPAEDGTPCDDETECSTDDVCTSGVCGGTTGCGDGTIDDECGEECDDGNTANGDGCSETCGPQTLCGDATADGEILTSDAQRALQNAVGINVQCDLTVCDVDASGSVQTNDALRILRAAVELEVELDCDYTP